MKEIESIQEAFAKHRQVIQKKNYCFKQSVILLSIVDNNMLLNKLQLNKATSAEAIIDLETSIIEDNYRKKYIQDLILLLDNQIN